MSPRPRRVTDEQLFAATQAVMSRVGPGGLTLAAIARQAGVTAAVLVQRLGSKRGLLLGIYERFAAGAGETMAALAGRHRSPLAAVRAYAGCMADLAASPAALARNLAYLQIDLTDTEFRRYLLRHARATQAALAGLLEEAVRRGELRASVQPRELARTLEAVIHGSLLTWAMYQEGGAEGWMRRDVEAVLRPHLARRAGRRRGGRRG